MNEFSAAFSLAFLDEMEKVGGPRWQRVKGVAKGLTRKVAIGGALFGAGSGVQALRSKPPQKPVPAPTAIHGPAEPGPKAPPKIVPKPKAAPKATPPQEAATPTKPSIDRLKESRERIREHITRGRTQEAARSGVKPPKHATQEMIASAEKGVAQDAKIKRMSKELGIGQEKAPETGEKPPKRSRSERAGEIHAEASALRRRAISGGNLSKSELKAMRERAEALRERAKGLGK